MVDLPQPSEQPIPRLGSSIIRNGIALLFTNLASLLVNHVDVIQTFLINYLPANIGPAVGPVLAAIAAVVNIYSPSKIIIERNAKPDIQSFYTKDK